MSWQPPRPPGASEEERIHYWSAMLEIPSSEVGADHLYLMARQRLEQLRRTQTGQHARPGESR